MLAASASVTAVRWTSERRGPQRGSRVGVPWAPVRGHPRQVNFETRSNLNLHSESRYSHSSRKRAKLMPLNQALLVAFGLTFVVLGSLYMLWRSLRDDRTASILRALTTAVSASV